MANLINDERDQDFLLYELLQIDNLCLRQRYADFSKDVFAMILAEAKKFGSEQIFPTLVEADREGCRLENGQVYVPKSFHKLYKLYCEGGWYGMNKPVESGGQGLPALISLAAKCWFMHNFAFTSYPGLTEGAAHLIDVYGTEEQKNLYLEKMMTGLWAGTMCLTEPQAGTDVGNIKTKATRQPDGTFLIQGTKLFITGGDHDLTENIIHPVLARIEGDPPGTEGISLFIVPKYRINPDGTLGPRNDITIGSIEEKMGLHGSSTCLMNFGDNNCCYGELLGKEREGIKIMFQMMNEARIGVGLQGLTSASIAYLHALNYAKERIQGASLLEMRNPLAPKVAIIHHPDVRRMLIWMKAHVEGMRALMFYTAYLVDQALSLEDEAEREKYRGIIELLTPICKAFCSDIGFRVTETAIQVYGGYGYCSEYPVEQFMRDEKIASIYEGTNGIQALDLVGRKLGMKKGLNFMHLLGEMNGTVTKYKDIPSLNDLANDVQQAVNTLGEISLFFAKVAKAGNFMLPVANAYPFLMMMGQVITAWLLFWEAGVAEEKLSLLCREKGMDKEDKNQLNLLVKENTEAAFYRGKLLTARYYIKHVLPQVYATQTAIKSEDLSMLDMADESFG